MSTLILYNSRQGSFEDLSYAKEFTILNSHLLTYLNDLLDTSTDPLVAAPSLT